MYMIQEDIEAAAVNFENNANDMVCSVCGSKKVQTKAWIDPNTRKFEEEIEFSHEDPKDNWCKECKANVELVLRKVYEEGLIPEIEKETPEPNSDDKLYNKTLNEINHEF